MRSGLIDVPLRVRSGLSSRAVRLLKGRSGVSTHFRSRDALVPIAGFLSREVLDTALLLLSFDEIVSTLLFPSRDEPVTALFFLSRDKHVLTPLLSSRGEVFSAFLFLSRDEPLVSAATLPGLADVDLRFGLNVLGIDDKCKPSSSDLHRSRFTAPQPLLRVRGDADTSEWFSSSGSERRLRFTGVSSSMTIASNMVLPRRTGVNLPDDDAVRRSLTTVLWVSLHCTFVGLCRVCLSLASVSTLTGVLRVCRSLTGGVSTEV